MSSDRVTAAVAAYQAAAAELLERSFEEFTHLKLLELLGELETTAWQLPAVGHRVTARLQREASAVELGCKSLKSVMVQRLRISGKEAKRRLAEAKELGPRTALNGEPLEPLLAPTATAQSKGSIGPEHVTEICSFLDKLPPRVDPEVRELSEKTLVAVGSATGPEEVRKAAEKLAAAIDQDGPEPDDRDRARKRYMTIGPQQADGMSRITGLLDPEARATLEPGLAKLSAPGMSNPDDCEPRTSGTPSQEQIDSDTRNHGQRTHDALIALARTAMSSGELGQHNGLPVTVIVTTTLQDLEAARGSGATGGGSLLPMADLIRMASHAHHYLAVFDKHTNEALYLGRTKRLASAAQRIMLHARDRGCTKPGCTVPGYGAQVHHTNGWAKNNGQTNIDEVTFACGGDNRLAEQGWTVTVGPDGVQWIPPPAIDVGQARLNYLHHPERLLVGPGP
ncbi:HNH endonuclease [Mycobacterium hodleri]|uniref:HNH endonuclease n=1 Tax=Mycolicibacterium hodleri TaxID=49897 RepID=A0A544W437_9MYCO|nr:HNH endonuclease signature motif containing protein [Mycolicibacterium hodleri]TQR86982.1 HNH endonuclease [Mycolicibacterium hodleri]